MGCFFFSSRRRHTRLTCDWSSDVCSSDLTERITAAVALEQAVVTGTAQLNGASRGLADEVARHLQALLRDVICGHLSTDLAALADELLLREHELEEQEDAEQADGGQEDAE